jgi:hypothetical protein
VRERDGALRVVVEPPIAVARDGDADAALDVAAQAFATGWTTTCAVTRRNGATGRA